MHIGVGLGVFVANLLRLRESAVWRTWLQALEIQQRMKWAEPCPGSGLRLAGPVWGEGPQT